MSKEIINNSLKEIAFYLIGFLAILFLGTFGYYFVEKWSFFDCLYMTVITLSSVGFMEVHPLSQEGRIFTMFLIIVGVGSFMALLTLLARASIAHQLDWIFKGKNMKTEIEKLDNHIIFCGFSRLSKTAISELKNKNKSLVIIEANQDRVSDARLEHDYVVHGDATKDDVLKEAGIAKASRIVTILPKDSDNLYVVLTAKEFNPDIYIISRAEDESGERRLQRAGADKIISPYRAGGRRIADGLLRPYVNDFLDLASSDNNSDLLLEEIIIPENSQLIGKTIRASNIREKTNIIIAAIIHNNSKMEYNPSAETIIEAKDTLICLGQTKSFALLEGMIQR